MRFEEDSKVIVYMAINGASKLHMAVNKASTGKLLTYTRPGVGYSFIILSFAVVFEDRINVFSFFFHKSVLLNSNLLFIILS